MGFALLYELSDLNVIGGSMNAAGSLNALPAADRTLAKKYWNGGIRDWATAPAYTGDPTCSSCRILACTFGTVAELVALLHRVADALGGDALYLHAIADDIAGASGHIEPYP